MTRTKIVCTIGPACNSKEQITALMHAGMNVARLNFSHGDHEQHREVIRLVKEVRKELSRPCAVMLDTKGPEIRVGLLEQELCFKAGEKFELVGEEKTGDRQIPITPGHVLEGLESGTQVCFDDGHINAKIEMDEGRAWVVMENEGCLKSRKGVHIMCENLNLPALTEKDKEDIAFGCHEDIDIIAASFIRSADHVLEIKRLLNSLGSPEILVIAKIESQEGVTNFDQIIQVADGIMIARGDLGVEMPLHELPSLQKMMIRKSYLAGKPSITATQMLESMIQNPRPTRAEVSDVANAIYDSTSAVMLSGETAMGRYPIEAVKFMKAIATHAEKDFDYESFFVNHLAVHYHDVPSGVALATVKTAYSSKASAVFTFTSSGRTARLMSRLRPNLPIVALTSIEKHYHQMALNWGVVPILDSYSESIEEAFKKASKAALKKCIVDYGDLVVVTAGTPFGVVGTTNVMIVESIGDVLVRGESSRGVRATGKVCMLPVAVEEKLSMAKGSILVLRSCDKDFQPFIKEAAGLILENEFEDRHSENYAFEMGDKYQIPVIIRADLASSLLKEGQLVTLDPEKNAVYEGVPPQCPVDQ